MPNPCNQRGVKVTIGLDFGTSATKCVINLEAFDNGKDKYLAVAFPSNSNPHGVLCLPTSIGINQGALVFGDEAECLAEDRIIRSFKMAIPCMNKSWGQYQSPFMSKSSPGYFDIQGHKFSAADMAALYLAVIVRQIKDQVRKFIRQGSDINFYLNLAAPLNQLIETSVCANNVDNDDILGIDEDKARDTSMSEQYIVLGQRCLWLSEHANNPWRLEDAISKLQMVKVYPIFPLEKSPAYVVPETLAAITGFINRPGTQSGRFMTLDIGAGSTDVSVFWLDKHGGAIKPWYYASRSLHVGMDAIDMALTSVAGSIRGGSPRARREALQLSAGGLADYEVSCNYVLQNIDRHRRKTFGKGYAKEKIPSNWGTREGAYVKLLLIGGGCQVDLVQDMANSELWQGVIGSPTVEVLSLDATKNLLRPDGREQAIDKMAAHSKQAFLLIIAEGLANKVIDIPEFGTCSKTLIARNQKHDEDRTPAHWW